jgi:polyisoprenoid-binding protein YceI
MTQPAAEASPADAPPPGSYALDPERTTVRADVKAMFGLFTVHGTFRLRSGQVTIAAEPGGSSVRASIDADSYASGNAKRDADVRSPGLLDARGFPDIVFTGRGAHRDGADWVVAGSVTAHGTPVPAQVRVTGVSGARTGGEAAIRFLATARLDRASFGVTRKKGMVGRTVTVVIETVGQRPERGLPPGAGQDL